jgi:D-glycero-D-manno-heptose 1,7-bisphosphate phosphatase
MNRAVFLDRDGTINEEMGYINHLSRFKIFDYVSEALKIFNELNFKVIVITNQSGIARGYFDEQLLRQVHQKLLSTVEGNLAKIDKIYFCPHHPKEGSDPYKKKCDCRKPAPGMLAFAQKDFNINFKESYMIGDRYKDVLLGKNNGLKSIFLLSGYGKGEYEYQKESWQTQPDYIAETLLEAAKWIAAENANQTHLQ